MSELTYDSCEVAAGLSAEYPLLEKYPSVMENHEWSSQTCTELVTAAT